MLADGSEEGEERWANLLELRSVTTRYDDLDARRRPRPLPRGDRPRRRPGLVRGAARTRSRSSRSTPPRASSSRSSSSPGWRRESSRTAARSTTRSSSRRSGGSPTSASPGPSGASSCRTPCRRATWGQGGLSVPSRFLFEIPAELMVGADAALGDDGDDDDAARSIPTWSSARGGAAGSGTPIRAGGGAVSGRAAAGPARPGPGERFRPTRDLGAKRGRYAGGRRRVGAARSRLDVPPARRAAATAPSDADRGCGSGAARGPAAARPAPPIPGRAPVPRRRPRPPRAPRRRHRRDLEADARRRGGHRRLLERRRVQDAPGESSPTWRSRSDERRAAGVRRGLTLTRSGRGDLAR